MFDRFKKYMEDIPITVTYTPLPTATSTASILIVNDKPPIVSVHKKPRRADAETKAQRLKTKLQEKSRLYNERKTEWHKKLTEQPCSVSAQTASAPVANEQHDQNIEQRFPTLCSIMDLRASTDTDMADDEMRKPGTDTDKERVLKPIVHSTVVVKSPNVLSVDDGKRINEKFPLMKHTWPSDDRVQLMVVADTFSRAEETAGFPFNGTVSFHIFPIYTHTQT